MKKIILLLIVISVFFSSCGGGGGYSPDVITDSPPTVLRVDPAACPVNTEVTVFGFGFSVAAPDNIIVIGAETIISTSYSFLTNPTNGELESLTFTIPDGMAAGTYSVIVLVDGNPSNSDITFEVTGV
ncbi:MAG: hypothetical protein COS89_07825 [Deltaproteobacteria bacterium CG07_land_8_20_14_0_80_38_7]|nr:MAG: hypothetical protein COS89_07825 [Deltaproteobacteria bacterium CG07_land_8_20_14_0_80_38_7]